MLVGGNGRAREFFTKHKQQLVCSTANFASNSSEKCSNFSVVDRAQGGVGSEGMLCSTVAGCLKSLPFLPQDGKIPEKYNSKTATMYKAEIQARNQPQHSQ
jgi:hypothetical protein